MDLSRYAILVKFFKKYEEINNARFDELIEFMRRVNDDFPRNVLDIIRNDTDHYAIHPSINRTSYIADFTRTDIEWWKSQFSTDIVVIKPIDDIINDFCIVVTQIAHDYKMDSFDIDLSEHLINLRKR